MTELYDDLDDAAVIREPVTISDAMLKEALRLRATRHAVRPIDITLPAPQRWDAIRRLYSAERDHIEAGIYTPYLANWDAIFTPIERAMWCSIRCYGGLRFFPQYPVGRYFVDFGDPWRQIAIECDGAQWHDEKADAIRDSNLAGLGWVVHRISGRDCFIYKEGARDPAFDFLERIFGHYGGSNPDQSDPDLDAEEEPE